MVLLLLDLCASKQNSCDALDLDCIHLHTFLVLDCNDVVQVALHGIDVVLNAVSAASVGRTSYTSLPLPQPLPYVPQSPPTLAHDVVACAFASTFQSTACSRNSLLLLDS